MQRVYESYQDQGFTILAVNATVQDQQSEAIAFAEKMNLTFPIILDLDGKFAHQYQNHALPTSFFINTDGIIQEVVIGGPMSETLLRTRVEMLLGIK